MSFTDFFRPKEIQPADEYDLARMELLKNEIGAGDASKFFEKKLNSANLVRAAVHGIKLGLIVATPLALIGSQLLKLAGHPELASTELILSPICALLAVGVGTQDAKADANVAEIMAIRDAILEPTVSEVSAPIQA